MILTDDRLAQAQAHIDAIKAKAEDDLAALRSAAASAKERVKSGVDELRAEYEPQPEPESVPAFGDENPTIEVDMPEEFSFTDFDPGAPQTPVEEIAATADAAPVVRFDPAENEITTDDDGIPIWEDPA